MDSAGLRAVQQPLKDAYREKPQDAVVTLRAHGDLEGDLDFRGTLAVSRDAPVGFRSIRLSFELDTEVSDEQVETLLRLAERYCVVYQTLAHPAEMTVSAPARGGGL